MSKVKRYKLTPGKIGPAFEASVVMCSGEDFELCGLCEKIHDSQQHFCPRTWVAPVAAGAASEAAPDNSILLPITDTNRCSNDI